MKKKTKIVSIALLSLLVIGLATASLLQYFGQITTTADVQQAVTLLGSPTHTIPESAPGGEEFCYLYKLDNKASVDIDVEFGTECYKDGIWENEQHTCDGVTTTMYNIPETRTLELCEKNPTTWQCVDEGATAILTFDPVSPTFDYELVAMNLVGSTEYKLIYYPDSGATSPTGKPWNMDNAVLIGTGTSDGSGNLNMNNNVDLGINLPKSTDYNAVPNVGDSYCNGENGYDYYDHCSGAKIWLITGEISNSNWNPTAWLFETDLIVYSDCDLDPENFVVDMEKDTDVTTLTTKSRDKTPMLVCYGFDEAIAPGTYVITTDIVP